MEEFKTALMVLGTFTLLRYLLSLMYCIVKRNGLVDRYIWRRIGLGREPTVEDFLG